MWRAYYKFDLKNVTHFNIFFFYSSPQESIIIYITAIVTIFRTDIVNQSFFTFILFLYLSSKHYYYKYTDIHLKL